MPENSQLVIVCVAALVFALAVAMLVREFRRTKRRSSTKSASEMQKPHVAPLLSLPPAAADDGDDVTKVGSLEELRAHSLPKLGLDNDSDDQTSDSTAMTLYEDGADLDEPTGSLDLIVLSAAAHSDVGTKRRRNEDSYLLDDKRSLFVVADGMGGYAGGDIASQLATKTIAAHVDRDQKSPGSPKRPRDGNLLVSSIEAANAAVYAEAQRNAEYHGMGTTVVAVSFTRRKRRGYIAYAGDSRCYRLRQSELKLLTEDHTFAARGVRGPMGDQIRRAVGIRPTVKVDLVVDSPRSDDVYLLCSDGLNKMLSDEILKKTLIDNREDLPSCALSLVRQANEAGGKDNITVVVVSVREAQARDAAATRASM